MIDLLDFSADDVWSLDIIGTGATRHVYALSSDLVVKVEPGHDKGQNAAEVARWEAATNDERALLAPIVAWADDYSWVVMERCQVRGSWSDLHTGEESNFCHACWKFGYCDLHAGNIGRNASGSLVLIDYAN